MGQAVPTGRFEWERLVRRVVLPKPVKLTAMILATYADPDGSRVRPGMEVLAAVTGDSERNARRMMDRLASLQLVTLVRRGGGRGGKGAASEYRLTIPADFLERFASLGPDESTPDSPDIQVSAQSSPDPVDNSVDTDESPDIQVSAQSVVDNPNDRTSNTVTKRMTGHFQRMTGHPDVRLPPTSPTTKETNPVVTTPRKSRPRARDPDDERRPDPHPVEAILEAS